MSRFVGHPLPPLNPALALELDFDEDQDHEHNAAMQLDILNMWLERAQDVIDGITL